MKLSYIPPALIFVIACAVFIRQQGTWQQPASSASSNRTSLWTKSFLNGIKRTEGSTTSAPASRNAAIAIKHGPTGPFRKEIILFLEHSTKLGGTIQASKIVLQQVRRNNLLELGGWSWEHKRCPRQSSNPNLLTSLSWSRYILGQSLCDSLSCSSR